MEKFINFMLMLLNNIMLALISGFCIQKLYTWFLIPLGLPYISIINCLGIRVLITALTHSKFDAINFTDWKNESKENNIKYHLITYIWWPMALFSGWIYKLFM